MFFTLLSRKGDVFVEEDMKKVLLACVLVLVTSSFALADWTENFAADYQASGVDQAVINAMKDGGSPEQIVAVGLQVEGLNPVLLVQALYCAGASGPDVEQAAFAAGLSGLIISAAYKDSVASCGDAVADTQAYTPPPTSFAPVFAGSRDTSTRVGFASEATF